jgi:ureidoglycolate hydrolase
MDEPSHLPPLDRFKVFRLRPNQAVLLKKGVWHGPPLAVDQPVFAVVLLHKGVGENDLYPVNFPETPVMIIA